MNDTCPYAMPDDEPIHTCWTDDAAARINTDCDHPLRTTDPACTGCVLREDEE